MGAIGTESIFGAGQRGVQMKTVTNERTYPHHVTIPVAAAGLDIALSRQIMEFHKSHTFNRDTDVKFSDTNKFIIAGAFPIWLRPTSFHEQFGGLLCETFELTQAAHA
jgi:hypothetical protein